MPKVNYQQNALRDVEVEVTQKELDAMKGPDGEARQTAIQAVTDRAVKLTIDKPDDYPWEWWFSVCTGPDDEELFDVG